MSMIEPKEIKRSRRRTIALIIDNSGELIVRAPFYATDKEIMTFVVQKQDWIAAKSQAMRQRKQEQPQLSLSEGERIPFLGREYEILRRNIAKPVLAKDILFIPDSKKAKDKLIAWYKEQAAGYLRVHVHEQALIMGVEPIGIKVTSAKTRWGSCSYQNHLNFSWHLILCPPEIVNYVIVHELCHIWHKNHGRNFWKSVELYDSQYRAHEQWLKDNRRIMEIMDEG